MFRIVLLPPTPMALTINAMIAMLAVRLAQDLLSTNVRLVEIILTPMEPLSLTTSTLATPSALWNVLLASTSGQATPMPARLALFSA